MKNKLNKIVLILIIMIMSFSIISTVDIVKATDENLNIEVWDGTIEEPTTTRRIDGELYYEIENAKQLAYLAENGGIWLNRNYILTNDIALNDVILDYNKNTGDLMVDESLLNEWTPIAQITSDDSNNDDIMFRGIFDGNNHIISGIYINNTNTECIGVRIVWGF